MFKCQITRRFSRLGEKPHKIVIEKRPRIYTRWVKDEEGNWSEEVCGKGWEIVKEIMVTQEGYNIWVNQGCPVKEVG